MKLKADPVTLTILGLAAIIVGGIAVGLIVPDDLNPFVREIAALVDPSVVK